MSAGNAEVLLVDGYNAIHCTPGLKAALERRGPQAAREALLAQLNARYRGTPYRVIVVFDGDGDVETTETPRRSPCRIVYTRHDESADAAIARMAARERAAGRSLCVITDDHAVRGAVADVGGRHTAVGEHHRQLNAPDRNRRKLAQTRAYIRRKLDGKAVE
ncbi:MAG TPA: NYN domain-containing protein [Ktedonobacterales bacterium]|nr:NYN domain-containing protein [Ktedonobacterales bacterium]